MNHKQQKAVEQFIEKHGDITFVEVPSANQVSLKIGHKVSKNVGISFSELEYLSYNFSNMSVGVTTDPTANHCMYITLFTTK